MSELTKCNYCSLKRLAEHHATKDADLVLVPYEDVVRGRQWTTVYVVPRGVTTEQLDAMSDEEFKPYFKAAFIDLADHCVC